MLHSYYYTNVIIIFTQNSTGPYTIIVILFYLSRNFKLINDLFIYCILKGTHLDFKNLVSI